MMRRITWSNIIANYRVLKEVLREGWERVPAGQSLFNRIMLTDGEQTVTMELKI